MTTTAPSTVSSDPGRPSLCRRGRRGLARLVGGAGLGAATLLLVAACGGGSSGGTKVASAGGSRATTTTVVSGTAEEQAIAYTTCLRQNGMDVPDPTVDANGNLQLGPPSGGSGNTPPPSFDQTAIQKAQEACGQPPAALTQGRNGGDQTQFQDQALKFTQCLRGEGLTVADPDFSSNAGPGAGIGNLDRSDPKVSAAIDKCSAGFTAPGGTPASSGG